jgi:hypothetical protein
MTDSYKASETNRSRERFTLLAENQKQDFGSELGISLDSQLQPELPCIEQLIQQFPRILLNDLIQAIQENPGDVDRLVDATFIDSVFIELRQAEESNDVSALLDIVEVLCRLVRLSALARFSCFEMSYAISDVIRRFFDHYEIRQGLIDVACIAAADAISSGVPDSLDRLRDLVQIQITNLKLESNYDDLERILKFFEGIYMYQNILSPTDLLSEADMQMILNVLIFDMWGWVGIDFVICLIKNIKNHDQIYWSEVLDSIQIMEVRQLTGKEKVDLVEALAEKMINCTGQQMILY